MAWALQAVERTRPFFVAGCVQLAVVVVAYYPLLRWFDLAGGLLCGLLQQLASLAVFLGKAPDVFGAERPG